MATKSATVSRIAALGYWAEADARVVVDAWRRSGETLSGFARRHGVQRRRLARWVQRLGAREPEATSFHPVRVVKRDGARVRQGSRIELVLGGGWRVRVRHGFEPDDLRNLLDVLESVR